MSTMNADDLNRLRTGDLVREEGSGQVYVVLASATDTKPAVAVKTVTVTNPTEWTLVAVSQYRPH